MKAYLSITQLGKIKHITTETLRHYDRIGLFTPGYIDPDTRYRYYSLDQIEQIDTILELRDMGMSLGRRQRLRISESWVSIFMIE